jgi:hypothetical protein
VIRWINLLGIAIDEGNTIQMTGRASSYSSLFPTPSGSHIGTTLCDLQSGDQSKEEQNRKATIWHLFLMGLTADLMVRFMGKP